MSDIKFTYYATLDGDTIFDQFIMRDQVTGFCYIVSMRNGSLTSRCKCERIEVTKMPDKLEGYIEGEKLDNTGMIVSAICENGTVLEITDYACSTVAIDGTVIISYIEAGIEYTTTISVSEVTPIENILVDFEYTKNADGTVTLNEWKQTLNGEPSTEMVFPNISSIIM